MRSWALICAFSIASTACVLPGRADDKPIFAPPDVGNSADVAIQLSGLTEEAPGKLKLLPEAAPAPQRLPNDPGYAVSQSPAIGPMHSTAGYAPSGDGSSAHGAGCGSGCQTTADCNDCGLTDCGSTDCGVGGGGSGGYSGGWSLAQPRSLSKRGIEIGGWIDQGVTLNASNPTDRFNGPVTFNDRDGEYQVNQAWLYVDREVDTGGYGLDVGGHIDFMFGSDARFTQSEGLEDSWNQTERFYQVALPQFYVDIGWNDWTVRVGQFYTLLGYEVVQAPDNFFYSHAYTMQYGEPFTHTGALLMRDIGQFSITGGVQRGINQFDDTDGIDSLGFLGGINWTSYNEDVTAAFAISSTEQGPGIEDMIYSFVGTWAVSNDVTYVIQHDYGQQYQTGANQSFATWYGINQYVLTQLNDSWALGFRFEWFRDRDGTRVTGQGDGNLNQGGFAGDFYALTAGLNWQPHPNVRFRPEARWDWFETQSLARPYDAGNQNSQFTGAIDMIVTF